MTVVLRLLPFFFVPSAKAFCWQIGWNPSFSGPPSVEQLKLHTVLGFFHATLSEHLLFEIVLKEEMVHFDIRAEKETRFQSNGKMCLKIVTVRTNF